MDAAAHIKISFDFNFSRMACSYKIFKNFIRNMFVKNSDVSICHDIFFEGFEFDAVFVRDIIDIDGCKIRKSGFGAYASEFWDCEADCIFFIGILVFPCFYVGQLKLSNVLLAAFVRVYFLGSFYVIQIVKKEAAL